ncbi:MAG: PSD1 and planctomycete cytochrome C domain-containing protein [Planctomycetaceae bacterium]
MPGRSEEEYRMLNKEFRMMKAVPSSSIEARQHLSEPVANRAQPLMIRSVVMAVLVSCVGQPAFAQESDSNRLFTLRVLPILKEKCLACHGDKADDIKGEFDMRTRQGTLKGGESEEPALVPGDPTASPLYQAVMWDGLEMPPKENDKLTKKQTDYIHAWIKAGAPWPGDEVQEKIRKAEWSVKENDDGVIVDTSGGLADEWTYRRYQPEDIWAFQPLKPVDVVGMKKDGQHPVDFFVDRKLKQAGLEPAPQADPKTLMRRASYNLTGLPPSPTDYYNFFQSWNKNPQQAWDNLITRLLDSNHYGERWAQHWLDVVRYADTSGFSNDYERSNAWRYRDYVIRSFNNDKSYRDFIVEQIAGDELAARRRKDEGGGQKKQLQPSSELLVATGFLRMGPFGTAMIPQEEIRQIYRDDLVHNVGQAFLSMPMRCCKCHDHKFDPIPTRDYYRMYAAFSATQPAEVKAKFLPEENREGLDQKKKLVKQLLDYATQKRDALHAKREAEAKRWYAEHNLPYKNNNARKDDPEDQKPPRHCGLSPEEQGRLKVREQDCWIWERRMERFEPMVQSVYNGQDQYLNARKMRKKGTKKNWQPQSFIFTGGALDAKGEPVVPGVLSGTQLPSASGDDPFVLPNEIEGRRIALAKWIANDKNPLTARSFVNRVWHYHFGKGLVDTPNNFGGKGGKPTHPELLDWLTADFIAHGWKVKRLHRLIMTSNVYKRSGKHPNQKELDNVDPNNKLLARFTPRRLTAEELRDSMLFVSGELNTEMGGVPIMPEINMEVALQPRMIQFSIAPAHQPSRTPDERNRRTIYAYRVRGQADPMLEILNQPNPNESCESRDSAAVSPQAFTLMNSDTVTDRSINFALRLIEENKGDHAAQIKRAINLVFGRNPTDTEAKSLADYYTEMRGYHTENKPRKIEYPKYVTRSLVEEFTGEPFTFQEWLNVYEDYKPGAKPGTVDAETRALADVCLLLLNSNEFVYVY